MFDFFITNKQIFKNQLGYKTGDSCMNQLLSNTHGTYASFDKGYKARDVFLDIPNTIDKV